jgi:NDP-sugar pyrophosphorylase family protein
MKIIIPMTGNGSRFVAAGYKDLKPLIKVSGMPVIQWIVERMYPKDTPFLFVCRQEHLERIPELRRTLTAIAPNSEIFAIDDWVKLGPVYDVLRAASSIDDDERCAINYCDFYMRWDYGRFEREVAARDCDGCVPCYTGFHPHLLVPENLYASCRVDADNNLLEIREKFSFTEDKTLTLHSPGVYYFRSGAILKKYCQMLVDSGETLKGEYYASLIYNNMVRDGLKVWVPANTTQFCQWGTPEDLQEYEFWISLIQGGERI